MAKILDSTDLEDSEGDNAESLLRITLVPIQLLSQIAYCLSYFFSY